MKCCTSTEEEPAKKPKAKKHEPTKKMPELKEPNREHSELVESLEDVTESDTSIDVGSTVLDSSSQSEPACQESNSTDSLLEELPLTTDTEKQSNDPDTSENKGDKKDEDLKQATIKESPRSNEAAAVGTTEKTQSSTHSTRHGFLILKKRSSSLAEKSKISQIKYKISQKRFASLQVAKTTTIEAQPSKPEERQQTLLYQSFIISNTVETALLGSCQLPVEFQLQFLSQTVYESILSSLVQAKPLGCKTQQSCEEIEQSVGAEESQFEKTVPLLLNSIKYLLESAGEPHSNINLVAVLQFWKELTSLVPNKILKWKSDKGVSSTSKERVITPMSSKVVFNILLDSLLKTSSKSLKLWQLGIYLMHTSLIQLCDQTLFTQTPELQLKFRKVLFKMFSILFTAQEVDKKVVEAFLRNVCSIPFQNPQNDGTWHGSNFLLETLIQLLDNW